MLHEGEGFGARSTEAEPGESTTTNQSKRKMKTISVVAEELCTYPVVVVKKRIRKSKRAKKIEEGISSGRKLIVFDLNGVLIHRTSVSDYIIRPGAIELLKYLSARCSLAIWTSAKKDTVKRIFRRLFDELSGFETTSFLFVWNQNQCTIEQPQINGKDADADAQLDQHGETVKCKPTFWKEVSKIFKEYPQFDYDGGCYLVDDSASKLERNPSKTSISLDSFQGSETDEAMCLGGEIYQLLSNLTA